MRPNGELLICGFSAALPVGLGDVPTSLSNASDLLLIAVGQRTAHLLAAPQTRVISLSSP